MFLIRRWNGMRYKWVGITFSLHGPNRRQREAMHLKLMWNFNMIILSLNVGIDWFCLLRTPRGFFNQKSGFTCSSGAIFYERINFLRNGNRKNRKQLMCLILFFSSNIRGQETDIIKMYKLFLEGGFKDQAFLKKKCI